MFILIGKEVAALTARIKAVEEAGGQPDEETARLLADHVKRLAMLESVEDAHTGAINALTARISSLGKAFKDLENDVTKLSLQVGMLAAKMEFEFYNTKEVPAVPAVPSELAIRKIKRSR